MLQHLSHQHGNIKDNTIYHRVVDVIYNDLD